MRKSWLAVAGYEDGSGPQAEEYLQLLKAEGKGTDLVWPSWDELHLEKACSGVGGRGRKQSQSGDLLWCGTHVDGCLLKVLE